LRSGPVPMKFPVAGADPKFRTPPVMVPMAVFWIESKSSKARLLEPSW
jgi:hypothetical protein